MLSLNGGVVLVFCQSSCHLTTDFTGGGSLVFCQIASRRSMNATVIYSLHFSRSRDYRCL